MDSTKIKNELGWKPEETFATGIRKTVEWYLNNLTWCKKVMKGKIELKILGIT